jgi:hypothetical protein
MFIQIIPKIGGQPIVIEASQLAVFGPVNGTPLVVAGEFGPSGAIKVSHAGDQDFNSTLRAFGYNHTVTVEALKLDPPPPGGKLIVPGGG